MNLDSRRIFGISVVCIGLSAGCTEKADHTAAEGPINSSADVPTTNETVRVNQPHAYQRAPAILANGTNVLLREASGAATSGAEGALAQRVKTSLQGDPMLLPVIQGIQINAKNGKIILGGVVQTEAQRQRIFELTRDLVGAENVDNQIQVKTTPDLSPGADVQKNTQP